MSVRLKTSVESGQKIEEMQKTLKLPTKASIVRIAVGISLQDESMPNLNVDVHGLELQRYTITGDNDALYKAMILQHCGKFLTDEDYFPKLFNAHIERGIVKLYSEFQLLGNKEKIIKYLLGV